MNGVTMAMNIKDLCRLCAKKEDFMKDLIDSNNLSVLKIIKDLIQIVISETDELPTKICLNCEEKTVSFQLFILECLRSQEYLRQMCVSSNDVEVKHESEYENSDMIKSEVKVEFSAEEVLCAINNDENILEYEKDDDGFDKNDFSENSDDDDNCLTLASLKQNKVSLQDSTKAPKRRYKKKNYVYEESEEVEKVLKKSNLKARDFVKSKSVLYKHVSEHKIRGKNSNDTQNDDVDLKYSNLKINDFVTFTCSVCEKKFSSWYSLKNHTEDMHNVAPVVNCVCGITLKSKSVLYKHIQDHKNPNMLCCDKCPRITKTIEALTKHKLRHIPKSERKFTCSTCEKIFVSKDALKSHEKSHIPIEDRKIYHCEICDLKFTTRSSAASHKRVVHDKIKSYVCDLCGYACGTNGELRQHRAIHSDDKPYVCKTCSKPFKTHSNLKTHMDTHEDTSYQCYVCNRVLNSRRTLRKHLLVHEEKCRHVCSYCHKAFKRRQTLKVHLYTHTGDKPLTCKWCDERFSYASTLRSHRLRCHPDKMAAQANNTSTYMQVPVSEQEVGHQVHEMQVSSSTVYDVGSGDEGASSAENEPRRFTVISLH